MSNNLRGCVSEPLEVVLELMGVNEYTPEKLVHSIVEDIALLAMLNDDDEMLNACQAKVDILRPLITNEMA
ncbi:hypothetical protein HWV00_20900 (plasmid) [Moritella sp. 24]|uniref:hypothetical protein n=1 Tax=Moritella sp. 24 TaxID=2746230 RepID=UPI001BABCD0C|nr:hypothetical protein [Moritella sp. 24]QUM78733.1 hypothetical protein HWV00_20900 [Moritella sp. 24]